jgi:hypothetical protein
VRPTAFVIDLSARARFFAAFRPFFFFLLIKCAGAFGVPIADRDAGPQRRRPHAGR